MKIPRSVLSAAFILSLVGFCLGLVLHGLTFLGFNPQVSFPTTWYSFQLITAFLFIPALISLGRRDLHTTPNSEGFRGVLSFIGVVFVLYAAFNFTFTDMVLLNGLEPSFIDGGYFVSSHGHSRMVSKEEWIKYSIYWARFSSGHWMAICTIIAAELYDHLLGPRAEQNMTMARKA